MNNELEQGKSSANRVGPQSQGRGCRKKTIHDVEGVGRESDKEEEFGALLDSPDDALDSDGASEPPGDGFAKEGARDDKYGERTQEGGPIRYDSASPRTESISR